jgi:hypothetical protein
VGLVAFAGTTKVITTGWNGGGSGIRTHVGVTQTCFQDMRLQPLGHPSRRDDFTMFLRIDNRVEFVGNPQSIHAISNQEKDLNLSGMQIASRKPITVLLGHLKITELQREITCCMFT